MDTKANREEKNRCGTMILASTSSAPFYSAAELHSLKGKAMKQLNQAAIAIAVAALATATGAQETQKLVGYLNLLDGDAAVREAHANGPTVSMTKYGLNAEEQQAVLSKDKQAVANLAGIELGNFRSPQIGNTRY